MFSLLAGVLQEFGQDLPGNSPAPSDPPVIPSPAFTVGSGPGDPPGRLPAVLATPPSQQEEEGPGGGGPLIPPSLPAVVRGCPTRPINGSSHSVQGGRPVYCSSQLELRSSVPHKSPPRVQFKYKLNPLKVVDSIGGDGDISCPLPRTPTPIPSNVLGLSPEPA